MIKAIVTATEYELQTLGFIELKTNQVIKVMKQGNFFSKVQLKGRTIMMLNSLFTIVKETTLDIKHSETFFEAHPEFC